MLRVLINQATDGMRLAMPVVHPRSGNILLRAGYVLNARVVEKLRELEVHEFWIAYPGTEDICRFVSPTIMAQQTKLTALVAGEFERVQSTGAATNTRLDFAEYRNVMRDLIELLLCDPLASSYIVEMAGGASNMLRHSSEVSFLSIALGLKLQDYLIAQRTRLSARDARNVAGLGIGALVHDVGYLKLEADVIERNRRGGLLAGDVEWRKHVPIGHHLLSGSIPAAAAGVILQHHQHFDGSGFPKVVDAGESAAGRRKAAAAFRGLKGEEIHVFARIACVANHFDRLRRPAVAGARGRAQPRVRVLKQMLFGPLRSRFDPAVLAALPAAAPAYQPGSMVKLSNGEHAVVLDWDPANPCRPSVQRIEVEGAAAGQPRSRTNSVRPVQSASDSLSRYDLAKCRELTIVEHEGRDVRGDNFDLPEPDEGDERGHKTAHPVRDAA